MYSDKITPEISEICGIHAGDGYLRNDGKRREWDISGSYDEKSYYDHHVIPLFSKTFNIEIIGRYFEHRGTYGFVIRNKELIEFVHNVLEFPYGKKTLIVRVPSSIRKSHDKQILTKFLRGYFDTDGHFSCFRREGKYCFFKRTYHHYPRLSISSVSKTLSKDVHSLCDKIGLQIKYRSYDPKKQSDNTKHYLESCGNSKIDNFFSIVCPQNSTKLSRYLIWKKFGFCPTNISYLERLKVLKGEINPYIYYGPVA